MFFSITAAAAIEALASISIEGVLALSVPFAAGLIAADHWEMEVAGKLYAAMTLPFLSVSIANSLSPDTAAYVSGTALVVAAFLSIPLIAARSDADISKAIRKY